MVARLVSCCASSPSAAGSARAASRTRGQPSGATVPAADASHGSRKNEPTMDGRRGALVPLAAGLCLKAERARGGWRVKSRGRWERGHQKKSEGASLQGEMACPDSPRTKIPAQRGFSEVMSIIHHLQWQHPVWYSHRTWWINQSALCKPISGRFMVMWQSRGPSLPRVSLHLSFSAGTFTHLPAT
jgi:hypothetical protein